MNLNLKKIYNQTALIVAITVIKNGNQFILHKKSFCKCLESSNDLKTINYICL